MQDPIIRRGDICWGDQVTSTWSYCNANVFTEHDLCNVLSIINIISSSSRIRLQSAWQAGDPLSNLRHLVRLKFHSALARDLASPILARLILIDNLNDALSETESQLDNNTPFRNSELVAVAYHQPFVSAHHLQSKWLQHSSPFVSQIDLETLSSCHKL